MGESLGCSMTEMDKVLPWWNDGRRSSLTSQKAKACKQGDFRQKWFFTRFNLKKPLEDEKQTFYTVLRLLLIWEKFDKGWEKFEKGWEISWELRKTQKKFEKGWERMRKKVISRLSTWAYGSWKKFESRNRLKNILRKDELVHFCRSFYRTNFNLSLIKKNNDKVTVQCFLHEQINLQLILQSTIGYIHWNMLLIVVVYDWVL